MLINTRKTAHILLLAIVAVCTLCGPTGQSADRIPRRALILAKVRSLQPRLTAPSAARIAAALDQSCSVRWELLLALAFTESSLNSSAIGKLNPRTTDFGIMQINADMVRRMRLDRARLMSDEGYSVSAACQILTENKARFSARIPFWLGLYRSGTAVWEPRVRANARAYDRRIRHLAWTLGLRPGPSMVAER